MLAGTACLAQQTGDSAELHHIVMPSMARVGGFYVGVTEAKPIYRVQKVIFCGSGTFLLVMLDTDRGRLLVLGGCTTQ